jgi:hypothetical protein
MDRDLTVAAISFRPSGPPRAYKEFNRPTNSRFRKSKQKTANARQSALMNGFNQRLIRLPAISAHERLSAVQMPRFNRKTAQDLFVICKQAFNCQLAVPSPLVGEG